MPADDGDICDYAVIGSGAGGGTVAARLAEAGMDVVLLEAGGDYREIAAPGLPEHGDVPAFHPLASENAALRWDYFVRHYADDRQQCRDAKAGPAGVLYPRAGTLGGCTLHNAMIFVSPDDEDWNAIAALTGDPSWRAENMRRYLRRVEDCRHRPFWRWLSRFGIDPTGHGWSGWLRTEQALPGEAFADDEIRRLVAATAWGDGIWRRLLGMIRREGDPNDQRWARRGFEGPAYTPLATAAHSRTGTYQRLREAAARLPDRLRIRLNALATRVVLDEGHRAVGVDYLRGPHLYRADPNAITASSGSPHHLRVRREVIVAGGAFNSPQLLMLSGIGSSAELAAHGIPVRVELSGVGRNLQDRYEIAVVNRLNRPWTSLSGARFDTADPIYREWHDRRRGMYISNGSAIAVTRRSTPQAPVPDLFCMALLARFYGYFPGYSRQITDHHDYLSWAILKAHTKNRAGTVTLRSADPRDPPAVNFHYFEEGDDPGGADLNAVVEGIRFVRRMVQAMGGDAVATEEMPGADCDGDEALAAYVRDNAWGHHASCSCAIGPRDKGGVLGSDFTVHGTQGLRVVDASIFPRIPGYFIASAIYIAAEKAADAVLAATLPCTADVVGNAGAVRA